MPTCPFCTVPPDEAWLVSDDAVALPHQRPLTACHILVAPRRHVPMFYDLDVEEQRKVWSVVEEIRNRITSALRVDGFDIGFAEAKAGESGHVHIHIVPRSPGERVVLPGDIEWIADTGSAGVMPENS